LTEIGRLYDSINKTVILPVENAARAQGYLFAASVVAARLAGLRGAKEGLRAVGSGAIMNPQ
jgi:hypothetical protein